MSEPFVGQITMFAGTFAPNGWALCNGQLLAISGNDALFSLLGTIYGGDGRSTFGLPDLRGRIPIGWGLGPGLSNHQQGQRSGVESVALNNNQMPPHTHTIPASTSPATGNDPAGNIPAGAMHYGNGRSVKMSPQATDNTGTGIGPTHPNMGPSLCLNFIIALVGIYPSRN